MPTRSTGSSTNATIESYDSIFALSDLFHEPPNFSPETLGTNAAGLPRNLGLSKALALLRARCLVLKEQIAQVRQIWRPTPAGTDLGAQKTADLLRQRQQTVPRLPREIDRLGSPLCELVE